MEIKLKAETVDRVMGYLTKQRWDQVEGLIHEIMAQVDVQRQPTTPQSQAVEPNPIPDTVVDDKSLAIKRKTK
jgi:hypothetical protein